MSSRTKPKKPERDKLRHRLWQRQKGRCYYCSGEMVSAKQPNNPDSATFEHLRPVLLGGGFTPDNIVLAHKRCNGDKAKAFNQQSDKLVVQEIVNDPRRMARHLRS